MENQIAKNENKVNILFSDILGTLISQYTTEIEYNKEFANLSVILNKYLSGNNYLVFVTSAYHMEFESEIVGLLQDLTNIIKPEYRNKIFYFVSRAQGLIERYENNIYISNGNPELEVNFINNKKESISIVLEKLYSYNINQIGAIGNDVSDIDMIYEVYKRGGITGVVTKEFYKDVSIDELINGIIHNKMPADKIITEYRQAHGNDKRFDVFDTIEWKEHRKKAKDMKMELYQSFQEGIISLEELKAMHFFADLENSYSMIASIPALSIAESLDLETPIHEKIEAIRTCFSHKILSKTKSLLLTEKMSSSE